MGSLDAQRLRLKQSPVDKWSTREKLSLASSVLRSGDQNWYSVSRSLKPFGEPNRPGDWFSQKNCALQYSELLENVETPKRKRGERGENTAEDLIVQELTIRRIDELKDLTMLEKKACSLLKEELESVKSGNASEEMLKEIWERMKREEREKEVAEEEYKKWLIERDAKIAAMKANRLGFLQLRSPKAVKTPPATCEITEDKKGDINSQSESSVVSEPLSVKIEDTSVTNDVVMEEKSPPMQTLIPSTSPLLTSLLQSPSPSAGSHNAFNMLSSVNLKDIQRSSHQFTSPSLPTVCSSHLVLPPSLPSVVDTSEPVTSPNKVTENLYVNSPQVTINPQNFSPTLSRLLETPQDTPVKVPAIVTEEDETPPIEETMEAEKIALDKIKKETILKEITEDVGMEESKESTETSLEEDAESRTEEFEKIETNESKVEDVKLTKNDVDTSDKPLDGPTEKEIKQETIDSKEILEECSIDEEMKIKSEVNEDESNNFSDLRTPDITPISSRSKRKRPSTSVAVLLNSRRSGRVRAAKEKGQDDDLPLSEPQTGAKKFSSSNFAVAAPSDVNIEELAEGGKSKPLSTFESVPNSPASSSTPSEDPESVKEYKMWKKSIMLLWRQAATHKFSTLFSHPVTDSEAKGYSTVVYRPMDLLSIRKKIENSTIKTTAEFQRDIMLMFQNAIMYNSVDHDVHQMAVEMQKEILEVIEDYIETQKQGSNNINETKPRGRRGNTSTTEDENTIASRRKSRTSTDTDPGVLTSKSKIKKKP